MWCGVSTIKEVAELANVSIGTVSNVLNGKTRNVELIERVEAAIQTLRYRPDANARNLKNTRSNVIGVILPNVMHPSHTAFLAALEAELRQHGYSLLVKVSQNNAVLEKKCVEMLLRQKVDGIVLYACRSDRNRYEYVLRESTPVIFLNSKVTGGTMADSVLVDFESALDTCMRRCREIGHEQIGLILERDFHQLDALVSVYASYYPNAGHVRRVDYTRERGFRAAYELLYENPKLSALVVGNSLLAAGAEKAICLLQKHVERKVDLIVIKEANWVEDDDRYRAIISFSNKALVEKVTLRLMESLESPSTHEPMVEYQHAEYKEIRPLLQGLSFAAPPDQKQINLYVFDSPAAHALQLLTETYMLHTGHDVRFTFFPYRALEGEVRDALRSHRDSMDGFMMDLVWMEELVATGAVQPLNEMRGFSQQEELLFSGGISPEYGLYEERRFGIPFMPGTQLLFYQKDLFEDQGLKRLFQRMYHAELTPPSTWVEFNMIAEFFTRSINHRSPVKYGASMVQGTDVYTVISFLNRLWAYGSDLFSGDQVIIKNQNTLVALKSFLKSYQYASTERMNLSWDEVSQEFKSGDCAMVVLYDSHAVDINDYTQSKVAGNVGACLIPGRAPVLGGWNFGIHQHGKNKEAALDFLLWACSSHGAIPYSVLGGTTLHREFYTRKDLDDLYPWYSLVPDSYAISRRRTAPRVLRSGSEAGEDYSTIVAEELQRMILGKQMPEEALQRMDSRLRKLTAKP